MLCASHYGCVVFVLNSAHVALCSRCVASVGSQTSKIIYYTFFAIHHNEIMSGKVDIGCSLG